jgi:hypothetical protein
LLEFVFAAHEKNDGVDSVFAKGSEDGHQNGLSSRSLFEAIAFVDFAHLNPSPTRLVHVENAGAQDAIPNSLVEGGEMSSNSLPCQSETSGTSGHPSPLQKPGHDLRTGKKITSHFGTTFHSVRRRCTSLCCRYLVSRILSEQLRKAFSNFEETSFGFSYLSGLFSSSATIASSFSARAPDTSNLFQDLPLWREAPVYPHALLRICSARKTFFQAFFLVSSTCYHSENRLTGNRLSSWIYSHLCRL